MRQFILAFLAAMVAVVFLGSVAETARMIRESDHLTVAGETVNRGRNEAPEAPVSDAETDPGLIVNGEDEEIIYIPAGHAIETTPVVCWVWSDTDVRCYPEEAPSGGRWQGEEMRGDSPVYSDGWVLQISETNRTVKWVQLETIDTVWV